MNIAYIIRSFFNIGIRLKFVVLVCVLLTAGTYFVTSQKMIKDVGGKTDYNEAMRYIEIKDIVDDKFIDQVDRSVMGDSAAAAMIAGLATSGAISCLPTSTRPISSTPPMSIPTLA